MGVRLHLTEFRVFAVFFLFPVVWGIVMSFRYYTLVGSEWVGFDNYRYIFTDDPCFGDRCGTRHTTQPGSCRSGSEKPC